MSLLLLLRPTAATPAGAAYSYGGDDVPTATYGGDG